MSFKFRSATREGGVSFLGMRIKLKVNTDLLRFSRARPAPHQIAPPFVTRLSFVIPIPFPPSTRLRRKSCRLLCSSDSNSLAALRDRLVAQITIPVTALVRTLAGSRPRAQRRILMGIHSPEGAALPLPIPDRRKDLHRRLSRSGRIPNPNPAPPVLNPKQKRRGSESAPSLDHLDSRPSPGSASLSDLTAPTSPRNTSWLRRPGRSCR